MNKYYFFYLEMSLRDPTDSHIYAFINVSHIPTVKLIELFNISQDKDPYLLEGYFLTRESYKQNKEYISANIGPLNQDVFEYCLRQYSSDDFREIRKLYKEDLLE